MMHPAIEKWAWIGVWIFGRFGYVGRCMDGSKVVGLLQNVLECPKSVFDYVSTPLDRSNVDISSHVET